MVNYFNVRKAWVESLSSAARVVTGIDGDENGIITIITSSAVIIGEVIRQDDLIDLRSKDSDELAQKLATGIEIDPVSIANAIIEKGIEDALEDGFELVDGGRVINLKNVAMKLLVGSRQTINTNVLSVNLDQVVAVLAGKVDIDNF